MYLATPGEGGGGIAIRSSQTVSINMAGAAADHVPTLTGLRVTPQPEAGRRTPMDTRTVEAAAAAPKRAHSQSANLGNSVKAGQDRDVQMNLVCSCAVHKPTPTPVGTESTLSAFLRVSFTVSMLAPEPPTAAWTFREL
jgi:hypothetical protein